jgi:hypothetical protein
VEKDNETKCNGKWMEMNRTRIRNNCLLNNLFSRTERLGEKIRRNPWFIWRCDYEECRWERQNKILRTGI